MLPCRWVPAALAALLACGPTRAAAQQREIPAQPADRSPAQLHDIPIQPGDRLLLKVEGEPALSDTFTVRSGPALELPGIGSVSLSGVRRHDLEPYLTHEIGRYVRNAVVQAKALVWVGLVGEVTKPGFYAVPADALLSDALMAAGGVTHDAELKKATVERNGAVVKNTSDTREALARGLTLEQAGIESGDQVTVPKRPDTERTARIVGLLLAVPVALFAMSKAF
jgi:polysaccharide export outer membrane protein